MQGSYHNDTSDPVKISFNKAASLDPAFGADVNTISNIKSKSGISPIQGIAIGMDNFNGTLNQVTQGISLMSEGVVGVIGDAVNAITTFDQPVNPESLSLEHRIYDGKTYLNQK